MTEKAPSTPVAGKPKRRSKGLWRRVWRAYRRSFLGMFGLTIVLLMLVVAFFAPLLANDQPILTKYNGKWAAPAVLDTLHNIPFAEKLIPKPAPYRLATFFFKEEFDPQRDWALWAPIPFDPLEQPAAPFQAPSSTHLLGTDDVGRDVASRMIHGTSVSIRVGFISMGIAALIGITLGGLAGYCGGWVDMLISRFIEIMMCFPTFFLILGILAWFPPRIENVMIVIGLTSWTGIARYTRAEYIKLRGADYAQAARALGAGPVRIMFRHLLPNSLAPVLVSVTFGIASAILVEAGLSWLGFGVQPPAPSWGNILRAGYDALIPAPHMIPPACGAIFFAVLAFNLVGDRLRDVIDPRLSNRR